MTGITCYDTAFNTQYPAGAAAYAAYVDGGVGNQPNYAYIVSAFPQAHHLSIALFAADNADALDVENYAASPSDIPGWHARQVARGISRPVVYASASVMEDQVLPVVSALPGGRASTRLWTAHYAGEHICGPGPGSCGELSVNADGTQWTSSAMGRILDQSLLLDNFFGTAPAPDWEDILLASIAVIKKGASGQPVKNWQGILVAYGYDLGTTGARKDGVDGSFGSATDTATRDFQKAKGLGVDGIVGQATYTAALKA